MLLLLLLVETVAAIVVEVVRFGVRECITEARSGLR